MYGANASKMPTYLMTQGISGSSKDGRTIVNETYAKAATAALFHHGTSNRMSNGSHGAFDFRIVIAMRAVLFV